MIRIPDQSVLGTVIAVACALAMPAAAQVQDIRLIVQVTVDGLRGDLLDRYGPRFGDDGFRRFMDGGTWYIDAHHRHANTETIVGHATLATGADPSVHGMIGNAWFDRAGGRLVYNIEDVDHPILPTQDWDGSLEQVDPAQAIAQAGGRSPRNLLATTFSDELVKATNGRSKAIGISGKDRSAVAMAGHRGKAFWMSAATGAFETSSYYHDAYPDWVVAFNDAKPADAAIGRAWELGDPIASYLLAENDDRPYETDLRGFGRTFPHVFSDPDSGLYYTQVLVSPLGDQITAGFAKAAVEAESLGADDNPDYLSVSFSDVDAANHFFGPSSLENEDMVRALDATLADLFGFLDAQVGREHVLYVLSADHGMPEMPEYMASQGFLTWRLQPADLHMALDASISATFGVDGAVKAFFRPYIYLDHDAISAAGADLDVIVQHGVDFLMRQDGISLALGTRPAPDLADHPLASSIRRNHHPVRSGDIYVAQTPYTFLFDAGPVSAMHGSPWRYDTHVPVMFAGPGIGAARVSRPVATTDVAVTLSALFGTTRPSGASGDVLNEIVR